MANDFRNEPRFLGISLSPAFVSEPQCNGEAERFMRTLKEQVLWRRRFQTTTDGKEPIAEFIEICNRAWLIERLGFRSPNQARTEFKRKAA